MSDIFKLKEIKDILEKKSALNLVFLYCTIGTQVIRAFAMFLKRVYCAKKALSMQLKQKAL